jgi:ABC-type nitrate/sulfonate/bicarbonate transport system substrate-binding protein
MRKECRSLLNAAAGVLVSITALAVHPAHCVEPIKMRVGWVVAPANLVPVLFAKPGLAKHLGKSYVFEPIYFGASPKEITALATGDIDIGALGFSTLPFAIQNAGLSDLRIIADEIRDGESDYFSTQYLVRQDSKINAVADLKGKVLATNGLGSGVHMAMTAVLQKAGLQDKRDYTTIEVPFPTMTAILKDGKADLITSLPPFVFASDLRTMARPLFAQKDGLGTSELSFWVAREGFIKKNRAALLDLLEDNIRAVRWYQDPANRNEAIELIANFLKRPPAALEQWIFNKNDFFRDRDTMVDLKSLQNNIDIMSKIGVIKEGFDVSKYADLSVVGEAALRLK